MSNIFLGIYHFFVRRKLLFFFLLVCSTAFLIFFASKVQLKENISQLLPSEKSTEQFNQFFQNSKIADRIMICITPKDTLSELYPDSMVVFSDSLAERLKKNLSTYIESLDYTANDSDVANVLSIIDNNLPLFLDEQDYKFIDSLTTDEGLIKKLQYNFRTLTSPAGMAMKQFIVKDPLGLNFIAYKKLQRFNAEGQIELYEQHFITKDKKHLLLFINPLFPSSDISRNAEFFKKMDGVIADVACGSRFTVVYFGAPAVSAGNSMQIRKDTLLTTSVTLILLVLMIGLFFRKFSAPFLVMLPVAFGALFALAIIYFIKGEISIIAVGAGSVVLGIAVNYSLHFLTHYHYHPDVRDTIKELAFPMTVGSATTIGGFLCLQFVKAPVLRDLGLFAALSLIGAAIASLAILPHLIFRKTSEIPAGNFSGDSFFDRMLQKLQSNKFILWMFVLLTPVFLYFASDVQFENDMNKINYMSPQLKEAEQIINKATSYYQKSIFVVSKGKSLDEALARNEFVSPSIQQMKEKGVISDYAGVSSLILSQKEQLKRIALWKNYWSDKKKKQVLSVLISEGGKIHFKESAFVPFENLTSKNFQPMTQKDMAVLEETFLKNFIENRSNEYSVISILKTSPLHAKEVYANLSAFPDVNVFDRQHITDSLVKIVAQDFNFITIFSSLLVFIALLLSYGRIELALITFIPMVISWIWILGIMALLGIKFNIINIILSTLVFALGDDYCIFTMDGLQQKYAKGQKSLASLRVSILFSAVTTIIGLGILIFAKHPALNSIALVSIIGIFCVWLVSQTLQPVLFNLIIKKPTDKKHSPYTLWGILKSVFAFFYFSFGALLLTVIGIVLTKLIPAKKKNMKYVYHRVLSKFVASLVYIMANVRKVIINEHNEKFSQPAIVIANHQSFLDILSLVMLHPKLILLTNKWVWKSPVFGAVVRMADYYPVVDGVEESIEKLSAIVKEGYSIVIFPEGTRSVDGVIKRFHKGAFFLAEKLKIDILPILLHGTGYCMTKGDFLLKDSQMTIKYLPRIKPEDSSYGETYSERAKYIGRFFRRQHKILSEQIETTSYFRHYLVSNFIFKGPVLEWYMKIKLSLENNYKLFNDLLPRHGNILDMGCGYGFMSYMLGYTSSQRKIKGVDYDSDKIEIARHGYLKSSNVSFEQANVLDYEFNRMDAVILSDVLHYLQPHEQISLLEKCVQGIQDKGMIVIRDGIKDLAKRHKGTKLTEWFSTIFGFNKTSEYGLSFLSSKLIYDLASKHDLQLSAIDNTKFTSNIIFILKKK